MKQENVIFITYDIRLRNYFTNQGIRWILTGLNQNNNKSFWVYNNTDDRVKNISIQWKNRNITLTD